MFFIMGISNGRKEINYDSGGMNICKSCGAYCRYRVSCTYMYMSLFFIPLFKWSKQYYQLTQFKKHYRDYAVKTNATMHLKHKPGEILQVDWAGQTAEDIDTDTGEVIPAYIFVSSLPYSGYAYVEAFFSMNQECWISAHVNAFKYFGGITKILQCDNLKTGVIKHGRSEDTLNKAYNEMAEN